MPHKILTKYNPNIDKYETLKAVSFIYSYIRESMSEEFKCIEVKSPMAINLKQESEVLIDRVIRFDSAMTNDIYKFEDNYFLWLKKVLKHTEGKMNQGVYSECPIINRDIIPTNTKALVSNVFVADVKIKQQEQTIEFLREIYTKVYAILGKLERELNKEYSKLKSKTFSKELLAISVLDLEQKYPTIEPIEREYELLSIGQNLALENFYSPLINSEFHRRARYDAFNWDLSSIISVSSNEIKEPIEVANISIRPNRRAIDEQASIVQQTIKSNYDQNLNEKNYLPSIFIKINIDELALILLRKIHISEVMLLPSDSELIEIKYKHKL